MMPRDMEFEMMEEEAELEEEWEYEYQDSPFDVLRPSWPSRPLHGTIPSGPYQVLTTCLAAINEDLGYLAENLHNLRISRQRRPPDRNLIRMFQTDVGLAFTRIRTRAQNGWYTQQGCTRANLKWLAAQLNRLQGLDPRIRGQVVNIIIRAANRAPRP